MLEFLGSIDRSLFQFINVQLANPVTDFIMPIITSDQLLRVLYGAAMAVLLWRGDKRIRWLVLFSALALALSDQLSAHVLKPIIERSRPCHVMAGINLLVGCGGGFSMPSAHAANSFAQATLFGLTARATRPYLFVIAALIALSRVMVGVHYPGDILVGAALGMLVGWLVAWLFRWLEATVINRSRKTHAVRD